MLICHDYFFVERKWLQNRQFVKDKIEIHLVLTLCFGLSKIKITFFI